MLRRRAFSKGGRGPAPERESSRAQTDDAKVAKMDPKTTDSGVSSKNAGRFGSWREPAPLGVFTRLSFYPWLVVGAVCIGAFMGQVDASIAQLVLPELRQSFHEPVRAVAWVSIAYLLVVTAMLPIVGRLSDILGRKLLYCCGFLVFVVGSGLCGLAPNLDSLIGARVLQALGATLMMANSVAIIVATVGPEPAWPGVGGAIRRSGGRPERWAGARRAADQPLGWRWVFWLNVPVGLIGAAIGFVVLPRTERAWSPGRSTSSAPYCWFRRSPCCCWRSIRRDGPRSARRSCSRPLSSAWRC